MGKRTTCIFRFKGFWSQTLPLSQEVVATVPRNEEQEKKSAYNEKVLQIEHGTFTPFFSIYGSMGRECRRFYSRLSDLLSEKRHLRKSITMNWIRTKICFALLKFSLLCLRGSQTLCKRFQCLTVQLLFLNLFLEFKDMSNSFCELI